MSADTQVSVMPEIWLLLWVDEGKIHFEDPTDQPADRLRGADANPSNGCF